MTSQPGRARVAAAVVAALAVGGSAWLVTGAGEPAAAPRTGGFATTASAPATPAPGPAEPTPDPGSARPSAPTRAPTPQVGRRSADIASLTAQALGDPPQRVVVPAAEVDLPVVPGGVDDRGAMEVPSGSFVAAWYRYGPGAGADSGAVVVAAHVSSRADGRGPFSRLAGLQPGGRVEVATSSGVVAYEVVRVEQVAKLALNTASLFERTGEHRLHLVTCGGRYDRAAGSYEDNVVVVARPLG